MLRRLWRWYFWSTPPIPYGTRSSRLRGWLWWHTHPRWIQEWRHALLWKHAAEEAAARQREPPDVNTAGGLWVE